MCWFRRRRGISEEAHTRSTQLSAASLSARSVQKSGVRPPGSQKTDGTQRSQSGPAVQLPSPSVMLALRKKSNKPPPKNAAEEIRELEEVLRAMGHTPDHAQLVKMVEARRNRLNTNSKLEKIGDIAFSLRQNRSEKRSMKDKKKKAAAAGDKQTPKKASQKDDDTLRPTLLQTRKEELDEEDEDHENGGCNTPPPEELVDEDAEDITEDNYMFHGREILYVCHELCRDTDVAPVLEGTPGDEAKLFKDMNVKATKVRWDPFRSLEEMQGAVERYVFGCFYLRRNTFLSNTMTMPKGKKPKPKTGRKPVIKVNTKLLNLDDFPTPKADIRSARSIYGSAKVSRTRRGQRKSGQVEECPTMESPISVRGDMVDKTQMSVDSARSHKK